MSEETEVKKDIEWLRKDFDRIFDQSILINSDKKWDKGHNVGWHEARATVYALLNQLDEPETLSQEWIDEHITDGHNVYLGDKVVYADELDGVLVPKEEKPAFDHDMYTKAIKEATDKGHLVIDGEKYELVKRPIIPQFVAEWIERNKQIEEKWNDYSKEDAMNDTIHFTIYGLFADYPATNSHVELRKPVLKWLSVDRGNYFKLVNAVRYGYEVEEEQKYNVKFKVKLSFGLVGIFLYKKGDEVLAGDNFKAYYPKEDECRLTEQEIRGFQNGDILFEHFAVKVEELEE